MDALKKLKRRLTLSDKEPNFDEYNDENDVDDDAHRDLHRDYNKAETEEDKYPQGRPNSMLNRLISHGNKKTEDEMIAGSAASKENQVPHAAGTAGTTTTGTTGTTSTSS